MNKNDKKSVKEVILERRNVQFFHDVPLVKLNNLLKKENKYQNV